MPLLDVSDVSVSFGGIKALSQISMNVDEGRMVGLIGPNGAGKSTLIGVLSGLCPPMTGTVTFKGRDLLSLPPHRRIRLGMSRTFQRLDLWDSMDVYDNVLTAADLAARWRSDIDPVRAANEAIERLSLEAVRTSQISELPTGTARLVEVARALASSPDLMLLDEPCAGLDNTETGRLGDVLSDVVASGTSILLVEHHVDVVFKFCSRVYVLDFGRVLAAGRPQEIQRNPAVRDAYLGELVETAS